MNLGDIADPLADVCVVEVPLYPLGLVVGRRLRGQNLVQRHHVGEYSPAVFVIDEVLQVCVAGDVTDDDDEVVLRAGLLAVDVDIRRPITGNRVNGGDGTFIFTGFTGNWKKETSKIRVHPYRSVS